MELFLIAVFILTLIFVIATLSRLRSQDDLIQELRKDLLRLRSEFIAEKDENTAVKSAMRERFEEVNESVEQSVVAGDPIKVAEELDLEPQPEPALPPPLPKFAMNAEAVEQSSPSKTLIEGPERPPAPVAKAPELPKIPVGPGPFRLFMERINLWPPSGDTAAEATIGGWWATRLGLVVGIIAATFAGIHVAESVSAWIRVMGLGAVAGGLVGLGVWLEKKIPAFGRLISAGGLGLAYFTAFAAFALKPMQVIESPIVALMVQAITVGLMVAWSLWRKDELVAGMATVLGYVSCWFSLQNDQMNFVIAGLLILGAAASFMLWCRQWLWSQGFAIAGTWIGFVALGFYEWEYHNAPPFGFILACLAGAALIFEAGHFLAGPKFDPHSASAKWMRRLSVASSSLSILVGFLVIDETYPELKSAFYLAFAVLMLGFSLVHYFCKHEISRGLDQMFFLKASALLCLYVVAEYEGPVRWMSFALQTGVLLWTWRQTRYRWLEIGFVVLFFVTLGIIGRGIFNDVDSNWFAFGPRNIIGALSLLAMSLWTALHRTWRFPDDEKQPGFDSVYNPLYVVGAIGIGITAWLLASFPHELPDNQLRSIFLLIAGVVIGLPLLRWRKAGPFIAATTALFAGFLKIIDTSGSWESMDRSSICVFAAALGIGGAELCRRYWPVHWRLEQTFRTLYAGFGMVLFYMVCSSIVRHYSIAQTFAVPLCITALAGIGALLLWQNSRPVWSATVQKMTAWPWLLAFLIGVLVCLFGCYPRAIDFACVWIAVAAAILLAASFLTRNAVPALAGGLPLAFGLLVYLKDFSRHSNQVDHTIAAVSIFLITVAIAIVFYRRTRQIDSPTFSGLELVLHGMALLVVHWLLRNFFDASAVFAIDCAVGLGVLILGRKWPMRSLKFASAIPIIFGVMHLVILGVGLYESGENAFWWLAAALVTLWVWLYHQGESLNLPDFSAPSPGGKLTFGWPVGIATVALWWITFHGSTAPWHPVAFAGFALLIMILWRFAGVKAGHIWTWILLASAVAGAVLVITSRDETAESRFASTIITCLIVAVHGLFYSRSEPQFRNLVIFHAIPAMGLVFWASAPGVLIVHELTTVFWGIASIILFVLGFIFGLKIYRIVGLVGIGLCLARIFIVDIEDDLYRIFAAFAVALVLLAVGFLYMKFRSRIENGPFSEKTVE